MRGPGRGAPGRSRRTPVSPRGGRGRRIPLIPVAVVSGIVVVLALVAFLIIQANQPTANDDKWARVEEDPAPDLPGEWVNLPEAYAEEGQLAHYGANSGPNTNAHVQRDVDYAAEQGLPPAGGPHWGSGNCSEHVADAAPFCGPVAWGIYRAPDFWDAESLVHNMEHAGVVVWYNTTNQQVIDDLENVVEDRLKGDKLVVLLPYRDLEPDTIALTAWARREKFPVSEFTKDRVEEFINIFNKRFNPEGF